MGFRDAKVRVIRCLLSGAYQHEQRGDIDVKNLLAIGEIGAAEVIEVLKHARGTDYSVSPHHRVRAVDVHLVKRQGWYIKWYFLTENGAPAGVEDDGAMFISIHR